jgi:hypothetical protein
MHAFRSATFAALLTLVAATPVIAADQAVTQPKPVVLDTPAPPQKATQPDMGGPAEAKPAAKTATKARTAKTAKKARKASGKKAKASQKKNKRARR